MGATLLVLLAGAEDLMWSPQTRRARRAELRDAGTLIADEVADAPPTHLGQFLQRVIAAFTPPDAPPAPQPPEPDPPAQAELPGMPPPRRPRIWM
jgi:hypothetical protein